MATTAVDSHFTSTLPQDGRLLQVSIASVPDDTLAIHQFSGSESLSGLFQFDLQLLAKPWAVQYGKIPPLKSLLGQSVSLSMLDGDPSEQQKRFFHGIISHIAATGFDERFYYFHAQMVPWLWLLQRKQQSRIFQQKTVFEILQLVFRGTKSPLVRFKDFTRTKYPQLDYCVQYQETDFNFVSRLMQRDGISYFFQHEKDKHTLILTDSNAVMPKTPAPHQEVRYYTSGWGDDLGNITHWKQAQQIRPAKYTLRDQHFRDPARPLEHSIADDHNSDLEVYDIYGDHAAPFNLPDRELTTDQEGDRLARVRIEETAVTGHVYTGTAAWRHFAGGFRFSLVNHPTLSGKFIPVAVGHSAHQSPSYISGQTEAIPYSAQVACVPDHVPIRPVRTAQAPAIPGVLTATVTVKNGEESWLDKFGRVRVQFHWDRDGKKNENSACWVRVAQPWADGAWGMHFWPREGQEVVIQFVEGDPDRPLITGCLYNAANMPPYELPANYTRSGLKTRSSKNAGSDEFNELRLEDNKGHEQVFLHAQKDMDFFVKNDHRSFVGGSRHSAVNGVQNVSIGADQSNNVTGNQMEKIGANLFLQVGDSQHQTVKHVYTLQAGDEIHLKSDAKIVIEGGSEVSIKGPGGFIDIGSSGIAIQGTKVNVNSGGSPASGTAANPQDPKPPDKTDNGKFGTKQS